MTRNLTSTFLVSFLLLLTSNAYSQDIRIGGYQSMKGLGVTMDIVEKDNSFHSFILYGDCFKVFSGRESWPGAFAAYAYDFSFSKRMFKEGVSASFYSGPGVAAGYVKDNAKDFGIMGGLYANFGLIVDFRRNVTICLGWSAEVAFHLKNSDKPDYEVLTIYKNGIYRSHFPELRILYRF